MREVQGHVVVSILKHNEDLIGRFESAFRSIIKTYVETTPIKVTNIEVIEMEDKISVRYAFDKVVFQYEYKDEKHTSVMNDAEFGRALFEFWTKYLVQDFFKDELKVETKHVEIIYFSTIPLGEVKI
ncbi:hypothetical protein COE95_18290 [Bacillus toyonensis]|uniref:hypothetical protein n=1 Tax=Bacillus toyonensis TaxID=155322 RepID=UPI000BF37AA1|nr:hypothetical protein [Bacillus toyonensis]PEP88783.1 hypothetical protein CN583_25820 [Bacillus toyonensis]PHC29322.1 hypothetical protein COE95_18290 [Bacillus toyonensis]